MQELSLAALSLIYTNPVEAVKAASAAGFRSVGLRLAAIPGSGVDNGLLENPGRLRELRRALDGEGMRLLDAEVFRFSPADGVLTPERPMLEAASELGARFVGITSYERDLPRNADLLGQLAATAREYRLSCLIEFMGFSGIRTLREARMVVDQSGAENAHVLVDPLHVSRTGTPLGELADLPPRYLPVAQICDADRDAVEPDPAKARAEAVWARLAPGTGALPLTDLIRALPPGIPLSVEVPCPPGTGPLEHAVSLRTAATALLASL